MQAIRIMRHCIRPMASSRAPKFNIEFCRSLTPISDLPFVRNKYSQSTGVKGLKSKKFKKEQSNEDDNEEACSEEDYDINDDSCVN